MKDEVIRGVECIVCGARAYEHPMVCETCIKQRDELLGLMQSLVNVYRGSESQWNEWLPSWIQKFEEAIATSEDK